ncbi:sulfotransferase [bacterium]|nr:sulfotransferase [bacterium]
MSVSSEVYIELKRAKEILKQDSPDRAYNFLIDLANRHPNIADYRAEAGAVALAADNIIDAEIHFKAALNLNQEHFNTLKNLSVLYTRRGQHKSAIKYSIAVLKLKRNDITAIFNLAHQLQVSARYNCAVKWYKHLLMLDSLNYDANNNLAAIYLLKGQDQNAMRHYLLALKVKPQEISIYRHLSLIQGYKFSEDEINHLNDILSSPTYSHSQRASAGFALWTHFKSTGDKVLSFELLNAANKFRHLELNLKAEQDLEVIESIQNFTSINHLPSLANCNFKKTPIFIVGMPRSGTTLLERILSSSDKVKPLGELEHIQKAMINHFVGQNLNLRSSLNSLRQEYLAKLPHFKESYWIDKMPLNFMYIGFIVSAFPSAKIIHIRRDPGPTIWSNFSHYFASNGNGFSYDLTSCANFYIRYLQIMNHWRQKYSLKILDIRYEELVSFPKHTSRKVFQNVGIPWSHSILDFHSSSSISNTASFKQVKKPIYTDGHKEWNNFQELIDPAILQLIMNIK